MTASHHETTSQLRGIPQGHNYRDVYVNGSNARVHLGDIFTLNNDIFNTGTAQERRAALLNLLYYDGLDMKHSQLQHIDVHPDSFLWIEKTEFRQWLQTGEKPFWINGKPGSGKSTLMKYLAESNQTHRFLNCGVQKWKIVYFFFDYRAAKSLANNFLGMLKNFLRQLCKTVPEVETHLSRYHDVLSSANLKHYVDTICNLIKLLGLNICAFIDGLDEYDGDLWDLCTQLEMFRDKSGMKLCLSSRPERAFEECYGTCPTITMQRYNDSSIRFLIEHKIAKFLVQNPVMHDPFTFPLREAILEKASGVILWARLVVDEMIKSCIQDTTSEDLLNFLDLLPPELEPLYQRLLEKVNLKCQQESAVMLHLLIEEGCPYEAVQFYQALSFIEVYVLRSRSVEDMAEVGAYEIRIKSLLGNMVDIGQPNSFKNMVDFCQPDPWDLRHIRLLHRSLSTYLCRTNWLSTHLPSRLQEMYPNRVWRRLAVHILTQATSDSVFQTDGFEKALEKHVNASIPFSQDMNIRVLDDTVESATSMRFRHRLEDLDVHWITSKQWQSRSDLVKSCIYSNLVVDDALRTSNELFVDSLHLLASFPRLAITHFMSCNLCYDWPSSWWHWVRVFRLYKADALDLVLKLGHGLYKSIADDFERRQVTLKRAEIEDLLDLVLIKRSAFVIEPIRPDRVHLLKVFADHGYLLDTRHLCAIHIALGEHDVKAAFIETVNVAKTLRPPLKWSSNHDRDCPYSTTGSCVLRHWFLSCYDGQLIHGLEVFLRAECLLQNSISLNGTSVFHQIIELWDHTPSRVWAKEGSQITVTEKYVLGLLPFMFKEVAKHGAVPIVRGPENNDLTYARSLWWSLKTHKWTFWRVAGDEFIARTPRLKFLSCSIQALEHYKKHGEWPDLEKVFRRST